MNKNDQSVKRFNWIIYLDKKTDALMCVAVGSKEADHATGKVIKGLYGTAKEAMLTLRRLEHERNRNNCTRE